MIVLKSTITVREAMGLETEGPNRTIKFGINNNSPFGIEVAFGHIKSTVSANGWTADWRLSVL